MHIENSLTMKYIKLAQSGKYDVCVWGAGYIGTGIGLELLRKRKIDIDFYCDNNTNLWGKKVVDEIVCISPEELRTKRDTVICFVMIGAVDKDAVLQQIKLLGIEKIVLYNELYEIETKDIFPFMKEKKIAVYTCIVGEYDDLKEPLSISPKCDYFVISDKKPTHKTVFQYMDIKNYVPDYIKDNTRKNRYCKINAHKIFPEYRYSVYFDGNIQLSDSIDELVESFPETRIIAFCGNFWSSIYREMMSVIQNKRDEKDLIIKQAKKYWLEGMPENFGTVMCGIMIREQNNPKCRAIMEEWWEQIDKYSKRDQISLPYVLWKNGYKITDVSTVTDKFSVKGKYWQFEREHNFPRTLSIQND